MGEWSFAKTERNEEWVRLHAEDGLTLSEIGEQYGVTRERVRQVVRKYGVPEWVTQEVYRAWREEEYGEKRAMYVCKECGVEFEGQRNKERRYCSECAVVGRPREYTDEEMLDALRNLALRLGHVPRTVDVNADPDTPSQVCYHNRFGSLTAAQEAAGLPPTRQGTSPEPVECRTESDSGAEHGSPPADPAA